MNDGLRTTPNFLFFGKDFLWTRDRGQEWTGWTEWTAEWTMDDGQEWTRTADDIFLCLSIRPLNVKSITSIRVPVH
jgi:hypothetical protein